MSAITCWPLAPFGWETWAAAGTAAKATMAAVAMSTKTRFRATAQVRARCMATLPRCALGKATLKALRPSRMRQIARSTPYLRPEPLEDERQLELELPVYDALYAWARRQVSELSR